MLLCFEKPLVRWHSYWNINYLQCKYSTSWPRKSLGTPIKLMSGHLGCTLIQTRHKKGRKRSDVIILLLFPYFCWRFVLSDHSLMVNTKYEPSSPTASAATWAARRKMLEQGVWLQPMFWQVVWSSWTLTVFMNPHCSRIFHLCRQ